MTAISPLMAQAGRLRIRVTDANGAVITTAEASLLDADDNRTRTTRANEIGEITFIDLPFGDCRFAVIAPGFSMRPLTVTLRNGDEVKIETVLEVGSVGGAVLVEPMSVAPRPTPAAISPPPQPKSPKRRRWLFFR